jgi:hypothetical protein
MNIAAFLSPRLRSPPPIPANADANSLEELAASFKTQGILAPLLVRELEESKYEVVAGGTSPQSGETGGTRKTSCPRSEANRCRGNRSPVR